jgi:predicted porin
MACLVGLPGLACAQAVPVIGGGSFTVADPGELADPMRHAVTTTAIRLGAYHGKTIDSTFSYYTLEPRSIQAGAAFGYPEEDLMGGQDRSWGVTVGIDYGALGLRGAHQNRHVADIRLFDQTGVNFDAKNSLAAANYRLSWGTAYAAYSANRGWGSSPLYNPDNPYSANIAGIASNDSRDMLAGVAVPLTHSTTLLASYIHKNDRELANRDANQLAIGASYTMSRRTDFYAAWSHIRNINSASYAESGLRNASSAINVGMRHAF